MGITMTTSELTRGLTALVRVELPFGLRRTLYTPGRASASVIHASSLEDAIAAARAIPGTMPGSYRPTATALLHAGHQWETRPAVMLGRGSARDALRSVRLGTLHEPERELGAHMHRIEPALAALIDDAHVIRIGA